MAYIRKRKDKRGYSWQAQVKLRRHQTLVKSFSKKRDSQVRAPALFEKGLSVPEVQLISGHKDPRVLLNT